jgi:hypothetical protein
LRERAATREQREMIGKIITSGETGASANILGKNYVKQIDVAMSGVDHRPGNHDLHEADGLVIRQERREPGRGKLRGCEEPS